MLCQKCQQREATVHITTIDGDKVTKREFCEECAGSDLLLPRSARVVEASAPLAVNFHRGPAKQSVLCQRCHEREATFHFCAVTGNETRKYDFCDECARLENGSEEGIKLGDFVEMLAAGQPQVPGRDQIVQCFAGRTVRYPIDAYEFVCRALENCQKGTHVAARVLLEAIRELALKKFGKRAKAALAEWKIFRTEDFGEIVFEMIDAGVFWKQPEDSKEDFQNGFNFDEAFPEK